MGCKQSSTLNETPETFSPVKAAAPAPATEIAAAVAVPAEAVKAFDEAVKAYDEITKKSTAEWTEVEKEDAVTVGSPIHKASTPTMNSDPSTPALTPKEAEEPVPMSFEPEVETKTEEVAAPVETAPVIEVFTSPMQTKTKTFAVAPQSIIQPAKKADAAPAAKKHVAFAPKPAAPKQSAKAAKAARPPRGKKNSKPMKKQSNVDEAMMQEMTMSFKRLLTHADHLERHLSTR